MRKLSLSGGGGAGEDLRRGISDLIKSDFHLLSPMDRCGAIPKILEWKSLHSFFDDPSVRDVASRGGLSYDE